jgi:hypothetical protein
MLLGHCRLHLGCAAERVDDAGELDQETVAGRLDDAAPMARNVRFDDLDAERLEPAERAFLIGLDQTRRAGDIGREDRRKPTFDATLPCGLHGASPVEDNPILTSARRALGKKALRLDAGPDVGPASCREIGRASGVISPK